MRRLSRMVPFGFTFFTECRFLSEAQLAERFGAQTTVQVREQQLARNRVKASTSDPSSQPYFKASVTARLGGFAVTLASSSSPSSASEASNAAMALAMASDVDKIAPESDPVYDKLRYLALGLGRMLRFSINHSVEAGSDPSSQVQCIAYEKDDWYLGNHFRQRLTAVGETPGAAFLAAMYGVTSHYQQELDASPRALEDIAELQRFLKTIGKRVSNPDIKKQLDGSRTTFTATVVVTDADKNEYSVSSGSVATSYAACRSVALQVHKIESDVPSPPTLLTRIKMQVDSMTHAVHRTAEVERLVQAFTSRSDWRMAPLTADAPLCEPEVTLDCQRASEEGFEATVFYGNTALAKCSAEGEYNSELGAFATACDQLITQHPDALDGQAYQTVNDLRKDFLSCTQFSAVDALKGSNISAYGVLGQCCSRHFNMFYGVTYTSLDAETHTCTVHVDDPALRGQRRIIGEATTKNKGQSWKTACINALCYNFPAQYREVKDRQDFNKGSENVRANRGNSQEALLKAISKLPFAERVAKAPTLLALVEGTGFIQLGWRQVTVHTDMDAQGTWRAELRRRDERNGKWVVLMKGTPAGTKRDAIKLVTFQAAKHYFPKELEEYLTLARSDVTQVEIDHLSRTAPFSREEPLLRRLLAEVDSSSTMTKLQVTASKSSPRQVTVSVVNSAAGGVVASVVSDVSLPEHNTTTGDACALVPLLQAALTAASKELKTEPRIVQLLTAFRNYSPPNVRQLQDVSDFLFGTMFGAVPTVHSELLANQWVTTLTLTVEPAGVDRVVLSRAAHSAKKESVRLAISNALQRNFAWLLQFYKRTTIELQNIADEILRAPQTFVADGSLVAQPEEPVPMPKSDEELKPRVISRGGGGSTKKITFTKMPPAPYTYLKSRVKVEHVDRSIALEHKVDPEGQHNCTIILRPLDAKSSIRPQAVGMGEGPTKAIALHHAALVAMDSLFTEELEAIVNQYPEWTDEPLAT